MRSLPGTCTTFVQVSGTFAWCSASPAHASAAAGAGAPWPRYGSSSGGRSTASPRARCLPAGTMAAAG
eukprot:13698322-Alexandrium_andersonii.AAC.1